MSGHFRLLDGLRGVAAIAVVAYHFGGRADLPYLQPRGYLAVDFFFVLSGFVLAHAYGERLRTTLTATRFVGQRMIRLLPMLVVGTLCGAVIEFWRPWTGGATSHFEQVIIAAVLGCLALPLPVSTSMEQTIFPINGPAWSLFFELIANFIFIIAARATFPRAAALTVMLIGGVGIADYSWISGTMDGGALLTNWPFGAPRVCYSFFAGVLVFACHDKIPQVPGWLSPCLLVAIFLVPVGPGDLGAGFDLPIVLILFPLMVASAARCQPQGFWLRACRLSGDISYPLYAIHYPIVRAVCFLINKHALTTPVRLGLAVATMLLVILMSWLLFRFYDRPVRQYLTNRLWSSRIAGDEASRHAAAV